MKRLLRWIGLTLGGLVALGIIGYAIVYVISERVMQHIYAIPAGALSIPTDAASIAEGQRLATVRGCYGGCHGRKAEGIVMFDEAMIGRVVAPNLTTIAHKYSDAELAVAIRNGVRPGGRGVIVMPSDAFVGLTDEDVGCIIAFLKALPVVAGPDASISMGPIGRVGLAVGKFKMAPQLIADTVPPPDATGEEASRGRYLARTICAHCHGTSLRGDSNPEFASPSLQVVSAYSPEAFAKLLRTGVPLGDRKLPTMGPWSTQHLSLLTDAEIAALYVYLHTMR